MGSAGGAGFAVAAGLLPCVAAGAGVGVGVPGLCGASAWLAGILPGAGVGCGVPGLCGASAWLAGILPGAGVGVGFGVPGLPMPPADVVLSCGVVLAEVPPGLAACAPAEDPAAGPEKLGEPADGETAADAGADGVAGRVVTVLREPRPGVTVLCSVLPVSPA
ncbi:hypothetical protein MB27_03285 [Actinoplanes utahensis]|uniref:Uncharacterized protein n=1 Tax=Actinoplanes utahensis TaxID=1869 RepID=A0A0A6URC3_ACTUT|nr:hypothetical protein MB27_03285 [Actinoplanes utahensis]